MTARTNRNTWARDVRVLLEQGKTPSIEVPPGARIIYRNARGRPRKNPVGDRFASWKMRTPAGFPMRCWRRRCSKQLRRDQVFTCSEYCRKTLLDQSQMIIDILEGRRPPEDFLAGWRVRRRSPRKR